MLIGGFAMTRLTSLLRLPNVTAYIIVGILIGPFGLDLIPENIIAHTDFLPDIALAFIAFSTAEFFRFSTLRKNGLKVLLLTLFESIAASLLVFVLSYLILGLNIAFSVVLAALAAATAPASTLMTIRQTGAKGEFVETLLQVVALDDIVGLVAYSLAVSVAVAVISGGGFNIGSVGLPLLANLGAVALGALFGFIMKLVISKSKSSDNRLIIAISLLFAFCGVCAMIEISPLLGCMSMGTVYINMTDDDKLFKQINYFSPPILLLFFVRSGVSFDLGALFSAGGNIGDTPLIIIGVLYFFVRILGKYAGAFAGAVVTKRSAPIRNYLGLALIPQAGVAIGLASLGARALGGGSGIALQTIILSSSVLYELVGPACAKLSLYLSGSYSNKIENIVPVDEAEAKSKNEVELLIERINVIRKELPQENPAEKAFTEAAENYDLYYPNQRKRTGKRRR
ncbi:MAG: cation:proton antiporter [Clostridia bacterium]|nr:cation:proton antiporter [Clostridia bacterium]MBP5754398.1 cation:proton antiporter [Clostridia bacterium]